jgi:hypothetical protein
MRHSPAPPDANHGRIGRLGNPDAGGGYFDSIKERNPDEFVSMATVADAPDGVERGVYVGGANYTKGDFSIGAIDYYSDDIINLFCAETEYALPLGGDLRQQFALLYSDQRSTGDNLLRGDPPSL